MYFNIPPHRKMCRLFDAKIRGAEYLKQVPWFDCSAYYATCKKGTLTSINITKNSIFLYLFQDYKPFQIFNSFFSSRIDQGTKIKRNAGIYE